MVSAKKKSAQRQKQYIWKIEMLPRWTWKNIMKNNKSPIKLSQNEYYEQNRDAKNHSRNQRYVENKDAEKLTRKQHYEKK